MASKVSYVDQKPAFAVGDEYFSKLEQNRLDEALDLYTEKFIRKEGHEWQQTIADLDAEVGGVTGFNPEDSQFAPATLNDGTVIPCVLIRYAVARGQILSEEKLTICAHQRGDQWGIAGHEITRLDTGEHFEAGLTVREKKILSLSLK